MPVYVAFLDCQNGHNILAGAFEAENTDNPHVFENMYAFMRQSLRQDIKAGELPPVCPRCLDPLQEIKLYCKQVRDPNQTLNQFQKFMREGEDENLQRVMKNYRKKLH
jgi:hypothetical protein